MNYQEFINAVENAVRKAADGTISVTVNKIVKNNNMERAGMVLTAPGINISPTIYLEESFKRYQSGAKVNEIANQILELYETVKIETPFECQRLMDYDRVKPHIVYKLIHFEKNKKLLMDIPYIPYLDLAIVFYILVELEEKGNASVLIQNDYLELWKKNINEIHEAAKQNTPVLLPWELKTMKAVINEMLTGKVCEEEEDYMYVLTNCSKNFGAGCLLYPKMLKRIWDKLGENYYVLPSSVHEVILIPQSQCPDKSELAEMICEINRTQLETEEILSDRPYYYCEAADCLMI